MSSPTQFPSFTFLCFMSFCFSFTSALLVICICSSKPVKPQRGQSMEHGSINCITKEKVSDNLHSLCSTREDQSYMERNEKWKISKSVDIGDWKMMHAILDSVQTCKKKFLKKVDQSVRQSSIFEMGNAHRQVGVAMSILVPHIFSSHQFFGEMCQS